MKYKVFGKIVGSRYLGEFEASSKEEAEEMALNDATCSLCHQCSREIEDPEVVSAEAEEVQE